MRKFLNKLKLIYSVPLWIISAILMGTGFGLYKLYLLIK